MGRTRPAGLIPVGVQVLSLANSTPGALSVAMQKSTVLDISVETQSARFGFNSTAPALTTGVLIIKDQQPFRLDSVQMSTLKFQRTTGTSKVTVLGYRRPGDPTS